MNSSGIKPLPDATDVIDFPQRARGDRLVAVVIGSNGIGATIFDRNGKLVAVSCDRQETLTNLAGLLDGLGLRLTKDWGR